MTRKKKAAAQTPGPEAKRPGRDRDARSESDVQKLLHELEVHQIELEIQNDELRLARDEAEDARAKYADLYDFAPVGFLTLDQSSLIKMVNLSGASLLGMERSRLVGRSFALHLASPFRSDFLAFLERVFATEEKHSIDLELLIEGQENRPVTVEARRAPEAASECQLTVADITERKRAEAALQRNVALFTNLFEQAPICVLFIDSAFRLQQANKMAEPNFGDLVSCLGQDFREILGQLWTKRVADRLAARFRHTLETGELYIAPEFRERRKDTKEMEDYEWQIQRLTLPDGDYGVVAFFNNVTERRKAQSAQLKLNLLTASNLKLKEAIERRKAIEKTLRKAKRKLAELLKQSDCQQIQLRDLSHRIIEAQEQERKRISRELHDVVLQSLAGINFQLVVVGKYLAENPQKLQQKIERAQGLVQDSMDLVHTFARELRPSVLDDLGLMPALDALIKNYLEDSGLRINLKVFEGVECIEGVERITLYRVVQEALANVARHAQTDRAEVSIQRNRNTIRMEITDYGKGFDPRAERLARKKGRMGMLGMKERVEMVDGVFTVQSTLGKSTTIRVELPFPRPDVGSSKS